MLVKVEVDSSLIVVELSSFVILYDANITNVGIWKSINKQIAFRAQTGASSTTARIVCISDDRKYNDTSEKGTHNSAATATFLECSKGRCGGGRQIVHVQIKFDNGAVKKRHSQAKCGWKMHDINNRIAYSRCNGDKYYGTCTRQRYRRR